jgi:MoxR-like ATPase
MSDADATAQVAQFHGRMTAALHSVIVGQGAAIDHVLVALLTGGHVLLTGGAASAKGLVVQCVARATRLDFKRIQFTPDLMPSDITGAEVLGDDATTGKRIARFVVGPVFTNILMGDEINRTPPKTQAALLEAMQERQVTVGGVSRPLPQPFFVMATKTSTETDGTYPLPEAQQDRFMLDVMMQPLSQDDELRVVLTDPAAGVDAIAPVVDGAGLLALQEIVRNVTIPAQVQQYIVGLTGASRPQTQEASAMVNQYVAWGAGVRASQCLALGAKATAAMAGRNTATMADVRAVALPVMRHRIGLNFRAENDGITTLNIIERLLDQVQPAPAAAPAAA